MDQLSSCYFCGAAPDASLDEYPVVPAALGDGSANRGTVVLCPNCKRKLDAVVDVVVGAADERADRSAGGGSGGTGAGNAAGARDATGDSTGSPASGGAGGGDDGGDGVGGGGGDDIEATLGDDDDVLQPVGDEGDGANVGDAADAADAGDATDTTDAADGEAGDDSPTYSGGRRAGYDGSSGDGGDGGGEDGDGGGKRDVTLTRLENTKVMRLLQNREFPVDRDDFVVVAASAYEISHSDCEKVLDLAVEHDLLDEQGGDLVAGSEWG